ncbi:hypothetical protein HanPI659440_Chr08g0292011 [Helianthus annuus]|nr:hypothetical protein HanPI659440_Chr08g0292011 [Helianthus annuus]
MKKGPCKEGDVDCVEVSVLHPDLPITTTIFRCLELWYSSIDYLFRKIKRF